MKNNNQIERYLKAFINEHNITTFNSSTIEQISKIDKGDLWNLTCNLIQAYYDKEKVKTENPHCFICKYFSLEDIGYDICVGDCRADNYKRVADNYSCDKYERKD